MERAYSSAMLTWREQQPLKSHEHLTNGILQRYISFTEEALNIPAWMGSDANDCGRLGILDMQSSMPTSAGLTENKEHT
jgi:hypothetical protein